MARLTFPLSRIEGHAQVVIEERNGQVKSAHFQATELRGFEYLVQGAPAGQMPVIVPRICGVCSTAHHVAAVKALEDVYGVTPPPLALKIRELLMLGQLLQNQATSLFIFTMPDRAGVSSIFEVNAPGVVSSRWGEGSDGATSLAVRALQVRQAGTHLIAAAGGQFIHPVKAVVGGITNGISGATIAEVRKELQWALPVAIELFDLYWEMSVALGERLGTWGDDAPACYLTGISVHQPNYYGERLNVMGCGEDKACVVFEARDFRKYLKLEDTDYSYAAQTSYQGEVLRANSLARVNLIQRMGTPAADQYLSRFHEAFGQPAHAIMLFDLARGIELVYAIERALQILSEPLDNEDTSVSYKPCDGEGYGLVEAPRGPLIHHYLVENGLIAKAEFIIPTVHNVLAIERALTVAAKRYISVEKVDLELERAVGRVVRAFDPCIACATH
ncbi:MAG: Ni/Fe hydrogenase subunit alpha [Anaerolineae bacterium]|nr:Ni/Fe hydrogenase subunit alpha [Anaerolineae bacterium]